MRCLRSLSPLAVLAGIFSGPLTGCEKPPKANEPVGHPAKNSNVPSRSGEPPTDQNAATQPQAEDASALLVPIAETHGLVGLAAAVVSSKGVLASGATGLRIRGGNETVTVADRWHLGSDTKAMTATLAAILVERGIIRWDQTVEETFASFQHSIDPTLRDLTLVELLTQRTGLTDDVLGRGPIWSHLRSSQEPLPVQRAWFTEQVLSEPPAGTAGLFAYANENYIVAGHFLEAATGQTWEELMQDELFTPLGMASCGFGAPATVNTKDAPWGHAGGDLTPVPPGPNADNPAALGPAGTVHCSLEDWGTFARLHLQGAHQDTELLSASSFARLHQGPGYGRPTEDTDYAYGWGVTERDWAGGLTLTHAGSNTMFFAIAWLAPAGDRAYLAVSNQADESARKGTDAAVAALVAAYPGGNQGP